MQIFTTLHMALAKDAIPEWIHLVPAGTFTGEDGRGPFTLEASEAVIERSMAGGKLAIDENHSTDTAAAEGRPSPARGWITKLEHRTDGLWGQVEWTASGQALLADKAYRGISPVIGATAEGKVVRVLRAALTNDPNLTLKSLHAQNRSSSMDLLTALRGALGLNADADQAAVIAAATSAHAKVTAHAAQIKAIAEAAGADAASTTEALVTHLNARSSEGDPKELRATVISLQSQLNTLTAATAKDKAEAFVDKSIADGKPVKPLRDHYVARHQKDPAGVATELAAMPSIHDGGIISPPKEGALAAGAPVTDIIAKATAHQREQKVKGIDMEWGAAVRAVTAS